MLTLTLPQPNFIVISQAYQMISDTHQTLVNEMPCLVNLDGAQMQAQILNQLNALTAMVKANPEIGTNTRKQIGPA